MGSNKIFVTGGAVPLNSPVYIRRHNDEEAFRVLRNREYLTILAPRQSGKTSLLQRLQAGAAEHYGYATALLDLSRFSTPDADWSTWSKDICENICDQLCQGQPDVIFPRTPPRFPDFLADLASYVKAPGMLILLDEASAIPLGIRNSFYSGIRWMYNDRSAPTKPILTRYTFAFAGVFNPKTLIKTPSSPFNITQNLYLDDFSESETAELLSNLTSIAEFELTEELVQNVYIWTGGQPYLTQVLADLLARHLENGYDASTAKQMIEALIPKLRKSTRVHIEHMIGPIIDNHELQQRVCQLIKGKSFHYAPSLNWQIAELELRGAIREGSDGQCRIRNRLYKTIIESICNNRHLTPEPDVYTPYEKGMTRLLKYIKSKIPEYRDSLIYSKSLRYQRRLNENIARSRLYGDTAETKSERGEIFTELSRLAKQKLDIDFEDLCHQQNSEQSNSDQFSGVAMADVTEGIQDSIIAGRDVYVNAGTRQASEPQRPDLSINQARLIALHGILTERFSQEDLRTLCFHLGVDWDNLPGRGKSAMARELLRFLKHRGRLADLVRIGKQQRPDIPWDEIIDIEG